MDNISYRDRKESGYAAVVIINGKIRISVIDQNDKAIGYIEFDPDLLMLPVRERFIEALA